MKKWLWLALALAAALSGCSLLNRDFSLDDSDFPDDNLGALVLQLDGSSIPTKTISPNMDIDHYVLTFDHPTNSNDFSVPSLAPGDVFVSNGLALGTWTLRVQALNTGGLTIGEINGLANQTVNLVITGGSILKTSVNVRPLSTPGAALQLALSWPGSLGDVSLTAHLAPAGAANPMASEYAKTFTVNNTSHTANYTESALASGYYLLFLQLYNTAATPQLLWGTIESVRIVSGLDTIGTGLTLVSGIGGLELTVTSDIPKEVQISWSASPPTIVAQGESVAVTAQVNPAAATAGYSYDYQWYLDGSSLGSGYKNLILSYSTAALAYRNYNLCLVVTEYQTGSPTVIRTIGSQGFSFGVVAP